MAPARRQRAVPDPVRSTPTATGDPPIRRSGPLLSLRINVTLPEGFWIRTFTNSHPGLRLEVLDRLEIGNRLTLLEVRVISDERTAWDEEIRRIPSVREVATLDGSVTYRVVFQGRTLIPLLKRLRLLRHFPIPVQDGVATWTVIGPEGKVQGLLKSLGESKVAYQVEAVHHGPLPRNPSRLTPRQEEILQRAMAEGYFDVPRRISLTKLAPKIGVSMSTLSVTLAVIEKKVLEPST